MVVTPSATPVTIPVDAPTVAVVVLDEDQVPPAVASVSVVVPPIQTTGVPPIVAGNAFTVATAVLRQPVGIR